MRLLLVEHIRKALVEVDSDNSGKHSIAREPHTKLTTRSRYYIDGACTEDSSNHILKI
jgi:hypothetical protein